jgi:hypothetical protein
MRATERLYRCERRLHGGFTRAEEGGGRGQRRVRRRGQRRVRQRGQRGQGRSGVNGDTARGTLGLGAASESSRPRDARPRAAQRVGKARGPGSRGRSWPEARRARRSGRRDVAFRPEKFQTGPVRARVSPKN